MITRKIAVPLVNEKILQQAEHCYIATAAISDEGFEFVRSRVGPKCKIDIVTGLDELSSPTVLQKIWKHYQGRINLTIYTRNALHANVYIFDLPFRKTVGFVGSGTLSLEGLKDQEEVFWKITDPRQVESLMSWYTTYFQFGVPLNEQIVREYEILYRHQQQRELLNRKEKEQFIALNASSFNWDLIRFRRQYFQKEDFQLFSIGNAYSDNAALRISREALREKLLKLHALVGDQLSKAGLIFSDERLQVEPAYYAERKVDSMYLRYTGKETDAGTFDVGIDQLTFFVRLQFGADLANAQNKMGFLQKLRDPGFANGLLERLQSLKAPHVIEVSGKRKGIETFQSGDAFKEFLGPDPFSIDGVRIERVYDPGNAGISADGIVETMINDILRLKQVLALT